MLSDRNIVMRGRSEYAHEQEALGFIRRALPDGDSLLVWELVELVDPSTGRLHEIDALILGYSALYLVEIKGGPGVYTGDTVDWYRQPPGEAARAMTPPLKLTNFKSKVLKSLLSHRMNEREVPWIQPLVFLSHEHVELKLRNYGDQCVVTQKNFARAITHHEFPGASLDRRPQRVSRPQANRLRQALSELGIRESEGSLRVGEWKLGEVFESGNGYEDRIATHASNPKSKRHARIYLVPEQTSTERRQQLRRAANREAQLLEDVKGHPNILHFTDAVSDAPLGPTVFFEAFDGVTLGTFLRQEKALSFADRIEIIAQVGRALDYCHKKSVEHNGLSPSAVLVRRDETGKIDTRLYNFQLGGGESASHTAHWSALAEEEWAVYQAPELRENPGADRKCADVFSLGALAFFVLTGRAPADNVVDADIKLRQFHFFDPLTVDDSLSNDVADCVREATQWNAFNRLDEPGFWIELLLERATTPAQAAPELDPLAARRGDSLGEYQVIRILGQGASSRVLEVERADGSTFALKVALNEHEDERLAEEAAILSAKDFRHPRLVQLYGAPKLGQRKCLLLGIAGERTLAQRLKDEGIISLDYAARFGEDLLTALEHLEELGILHRDIKPANIGVGAFRKKAHHLTLFDFSLAIDLGSTQLARHGISQITVGTVAYRDPFLVDRGSWDFAADRFSAAVTLHEMLTGARPAWTPEGASARDPEAKLVLAEERFDADVRDRLTAFFERAFRANAAERHPSSEAMRKAWLECFSVQGITIPLSGSTIQAKLEAGAVSIDPSTENLPPAELAQSPSSADLSAMGADAPLGALPLSGRALNALDRAGVTRAGELVSLPDNRLSAVRGVGKEVVKEILRVKEAWMSSHTPTPGAEDPFFSGYGGPDRLLSETALEAELVRSLKDAGLATLRAVALAPAAQVELLLKRAGAKKSALQGFLKTVQKEEEARSRPTSVDGWLRILLPKQPKRAENLKTLFGMSGSGAGRTDLSFSEAARSLAVTPPNLHIAVAQAKAEWLSLEALPELCRSVHEILRPAGGALPVERAAVHLLDRYPPTPQLAELIELEDQERQKIVGAAALLRIVGIVEKESETGVRWERLEGGGPWLVESVDLLPALQALGAAADALAARDSVASSGETSRALRAATFDTPLASLSDERLTELGALASRTAARSSRLEIYPRGLSAKRAIELSNAILVGKLRPEEVPKRVRARYPEGELLPDRPALDGLLAPLGLEWDPGEGVFSRPEQDSRSVGTYFPSSLPNLATHQRRLDPEHIESHDFEERIRIAIERSRFRVLSVRVDRAESVALGLAETFGLELVDLNREFVLGLRELMRQQEIDETLVHSIDRERNENFAALTEMMSDVGQEILDRLLAAPRPRLYANPGLLARYRLDGFLRRLVQSCREKDAVGTFLLVPAHEGSGSSVPRINGSLVIPEVGIPDTLIIPPKWNRTVKKAG